jgi:hypothetical protein
MLRRLRIVWSAAVNARNNVLRILARFALHANEPIVARLPTARSCLAVCTDVGRQKLEFQPRGSTVSRPGNSRTYSLVGVLVGLLGMLVGKLAMLMSRNSMLLRLFVLAHFVMMDRFAVVMFGRRMMASCGVVVFAGGMFHCHGILRSVL